MPDTTDKGTEAFDKAATSGEAKVAESKYQQRLKALGRAAVGVELPLELHEMMLAAAHADNDIAISAWVRKQWAITVNALNLTKTLPDGSVVPWKFDINVLEEKAARNSSTKNLPPEEKAKVEAKKKEAAKDQRALVNQLLAEHKAKLAAAAGKPAPPPMPDEADDDDEPMPITGTPMGQADTDEEELIEDDDDESRPESGFDKDGNPVDDNED